MDSRKFRKPPQSPPVFTTTPQFILETATQLLSSSRTLQLSLISTLTPTTAKFANTIAPLAQDENIRQKSGHVLEFYQHVSAHAELRDASREAAGLLDDFAIEAGMNEGLFELVRGVVEKNEVVSAEEGFYLEKMVKGYMRNGLGLPKEESERFKTIQKRIAQIAVAFRGNLGSEKGGIWFEEAELEGVPLDTLSGFETEEEGRRKVSFKYPDVTAVLTHAVDPETRRRMLVGNANKLPQNSPLLKEMLVLRDEAARLLGYENHAAFRLEEKMMKTPEAVNNFLNGLRGKLTPKAIEEVEKLKELKKLDLENRGEVWDRKYYMWDDKYYQRTMLEKDFQIDGQKIAEYFPLDATVQKMLGIFETLFGMKFVEIAGKGRDDLAENGKGEEMVWHPDVKVYAAWNDGEEGEFLGYLYMDLYPRPDKFGNASNWNLRPGFIDADGQRSYPATALLCSFTAPTSTKPSLLKHEEIVLLFHELGHGIHDLLGQTKYAKYHGTMCVADFCEAPSQLLEYWCWSPGPLKALSQHYSTLSPSYQQVHLDSLSSSATSLPEPQIPDAMIANLLRTKNVNNALFTLVTLHAATFDMVVHQPSSHEDAQEMNISQIWNGLRSQIMPVEGPRGEEWGCGEGNFPQLVGDYDAGIYGYLTADAYAADIWRAFFKADPMDATQGRRYRHSVLRHGGSRDEMGMLEAYLGRNTDADAMAKEMGWAS